MEDPEYQKVTIVIENSKEVITYVYYKVVNLMPFVEHEEPEIYQFNDRIIGYEPDRLKAIGITFKPLAVEGGKYGDVTVKPRPS